MVAAQFGKQVLLATHSPEIIREAALTKILVVKQGGKTNYLASEDQKVAMMLGIGSLYSPKFDRIRSAKRVFFFEGTSDPAILKEIARVRSLEWPASLPGWATTQNQRERRTIWRALCSEFGEVRALSLRDRDDEPINSVGALLEDKSDGQPEVNFLQRKWRRRHIESYLVVPSAIARAVRSSTTQVEAVLAADFSIAINATSYLASEASTTLLDLRGKDILGEFGLNAIDVAKVLEPGEVCADLTQLVTEIIEFA